MHICLGASTHSSLLGFVCVDMWNSRAETLNRQSCMWGCHGYSILAHLCFFFLSNLTFLLFFYYCYFLFFWVFLVLSTKVILNVVLSLSRFILSSNLVFICPLYSVFLSIMFVLALIMREAGTQRLKFSCKRSCLVKLCCILKWFFKEENDLIVNKVLDSGGVLSQPWHGWVGVGVGGYVCKKMLFDQTDFPFLIATLYQRHCVWWFPCFQKLIF